MIYKCIDSYAFPDDGKEWLDCPRCKLKPKVWVFNNGRSTACGCGENKYQHFRVEAEDIISHHRANNGSVANYDQDELRRNWNNYCKEKIT